MREGVSYVQVSGLVEYIRNIIPDSMAVSSPAFLGHLGRGYAELRHNGVLRTSHKALSANFAITEF
jgi:hypothetical protein